MEEKHVRVPAELVERAEALVAPVKSATLGAARWSQTAIVRLALDWGLSYLEELIERGAPLAPPKVLPTLPRTPIAPPRTPIAPPRTPIAPPRARIRYVALVDSAEVWGEVECSKGEAIALAARYLDAEKVADGWRYFDNGTQEDHASSDDAVAALGAALLAGYKDVYSIWCAHF